MKTFVIDAAGRHWTWNCGWHCLNPKPHAHGGRPGVLGHTAFHRLPKATRADINARTITILDRPVGQWRRWITEIEAGTYTLFEHELFGFGHILANDGMHAMFKPLNVDKYPNPVKVMFDNLIESKPIACTSKKSLPVKEKKAREKKLKFSIDDLL